MEKIFGYDIICYDDAIEFAMEFCKKTDNQEGKNLKKELFENMKVMHSLRMVHRDMKFQNIGWSPEF